MRLRQEQVVFAGAVALLALLVTGTLRSGALPGSRGAGSGQAPPFVHHPTPDVSRALAPTPASASTMPERDPRALVRSLFEPPRDTEVLPPLEPEPPPRQPLAALRPPAAAGPEPRLFDEFLREPAVVAPTPVDGLFQELEPEEAEPAAFEAPDEEAELTASERVAQIQGYKRTYDWLRMPGFHWGQVRNKDRYSLESRPDEAFLWVEFDPETGAERFPGQPPIEIARARVEEFGFAQTPENEIELRRREFQGELTPGQYPRVIECATWCLERHPAATNALAVAEELFTHAEKVSGGDSAAWLGLARCHEMGFAFEKAYQVYRGLLERGKAEDPLVLTRLAELLARFRLFERAEELLTTAEGFGRNRWEVQWAFGRFLLERGRSKEALAHLESAARLEPTSPERQRERAGIRADYAAALLHQGDLAGAESWYRKSQAAEPESDERALAGIESVHYLESGGLESGGLQPAGGSNGNTPLVESEGDFEGAGFDALLVQGLLAMRQGDAAGAALKLEGAAAADPLRASIAWRALSYLAEVSGYSAEALRFAEQATENDPTDAYALIQRGRVLAARDDVAGALESFTAALDQELELPDVAAAMGEIHFRLDRNEEAERYLEASILLDADVAGFHTLRGLNQLELNRAREAQASFERALELDRTDPTARCGLAWCAYLAGDSVEAMTLYRELDDSRRDRAEEDAFRAYARRQIERITEHEQKVVWTDRFERNELMNAWVPEEEAGPQVGLKEGALAIDGAFKAQGRARAKRQYNAADFVSLEARVTVHAGSKVRAGLFVAIERSVRSQTQVTSEITLSRHPDGAIQTRFLRRGEDDLPYEDVPVLDWPLDKPVSLRIERYGESSDTRFRLTVDGIPVAEDVKVPTMSSTSAELWVGVFAEGEPGRSVSLEVDDVQVVKRQRQ